MIKNKVTDFIIKKPEEVSKMPNHMLTDVRAMLKDCIFMIPDHIDNNQRKLVYKVGFLKEVYTILYPDNKNWELFTMIDDTWQIFKSQRQMERLSAEYVRLVEKGEI